MADLALLEAAETETAPLFDAGPLDISVEAGPDNLSSRAAEPRVRRNGTLQYRLAAGDLLGLALVSGLALAAGWPVRAAALATALCLGGLRAVNLYSVPVTARALDQVTRIGFATAAGALATATFTGQSAARASLFAVMSSAVLVMSRGLHYAVERHRVTARTRRVLLVGAGRAAQEFADRLMGHPEYGMTPVGFVDEGPTLLDPDLRLGVVGRPHDIPRLVRELNVERIIIDEEACSVEGMTELLQAAARSCPEVSVLPVLAQNLSSAVEVEALAGVTLLTYRPSRLRGVSWSAKRVVDIVGSTLLLLLALPVLLLCAAAVRIDSSGPVLFRQERVGRNGRLFTMFKFRTMCVDAEDRLPSLIDLNECEGPYFKVSADPRVTRVGRFLRRTSLDELPQLLNVLRGEMSLVGPRPCLDRELSLCPEWFHHRFDVPPGLTGLWQVSGRFRLPFHEASRLDVFYVDHWSLSLDIKILLRTPGVVLLGKGAR